MGFTSSLALLPLLLALVSRGSAQLEFNKTGNVTTTVCDRSVLLPCYVANLKEHKASALFVTWKYNDLAFYAFDGGSNDTKITPNFSSATLNLQELPKGDISLTVVNVSQAVEGKYTCDVIELSRTAATTFSLKYSQLQVLQPKESVPITILLCLAVLEFWMHFGFTFSSFYKYKPSKTAVKVTAVAGIILTILVIVGFALLFTNDYSTASVAGLGIAVIPTMSLILVLQHFLHPSNVVLLLFLALKILGLVIAIVGYGFCVSTCPPTQAVILLSGIAVFTAFVFADLVYSLIQEIYSKPTSTY